MAAPGLKPIDELVRRAMIGDGAAFTKLWDTHIDALKVYLKGIMKHLDDFYIDDICSRSFEKAFRQIGSYDPSKSQFSTWLKVIAHNTALDTIEQEARAQRGYVWIDDDSRQLNISEIRDDIDTPLDSIIKNEDQEETQGYIEGLPDLYREIARKRLIDGLQYKEIAEETGLELNTVRTRIRRAKAMIEKMKSE
ncbi:MAG: sigma-70 family RNA polymerase sigma factor [Bacteroidales bacterium]|nr:sigma-70 family RNA polymerase sigma factor [Bacteroidales bacterium]